jgi:hypothetical protein
MPFYSAEARADNQQAIGEQLYYFRSLSNPPNTRDCLVMAHGGFTEGTDGMFTVPAGVNIHFYIPHGATANNPSVQLHILERSHHVDNHIYGPGQECYNYQLQKVLGHGADVGGKGSRGGYYLQVSNYMEDAGLSMAHAGPRNWAPNIATVRHRIFSSRSVTLESLVHQVKDAHAGLTDFYILACRAVFRRSGPLNRRHITAHEAIRLN